MNRSPGCDRDRKRAIVNEASGGGSGMIAAGIVGG